MTTSSRGPYDPLRWFQMRALKSKGWTNRQIAMQFNVTPQAVTMTLSTPFPATRVEMLEMLIKWRERATDDKEKQVIDGMIQLVARLPEDAPALASPQGGSFKALPEPQRASAA